MYIIAKAKAKLALKGGGLNQYLLGSPPFNEWGIFKVLQDP